jgi:hypothetical protein
LEIKSLLYEEGFTIAGAKKKLKENEKDILPALAPVEDLPVLQNQDHLELLRSIREDLLSLYDLLS